MGLLAVLNEVRGTKLSAKLRNAMAMYDLMKTNPALLSADWTNADDSRNYLPFFRQVSQEPRPRHARASRRRRAEAIRAPTPATPARGTTGVCTPYRGLLAAQKRVPLEEVSARRTVFSPFAQLSLPAEQKTARREALRSPRAQTPSSGWQICAPRSSTPWRKRRRANSARWPWNPSPAGPPRGARSVPRSGNPLRWPSIQPKHRDQHSISLCSAQRSC